MYWPLLSNLVNCIFFCRHPDIKRTICKKCGLALEPGISSILGVDPKNGNVFQIECSQCGYKKNFVINEDYKFWLENPESVVEIIGDRHVENLRNM